MELKILFAIYLVFYFFSHSLLAATRVKDILQRTSIIPFRYYRLFFNFLAVLLLIPVVVLYYLSEKHVFFELNFAGNLIGYLCIIFGIYLWKLSFRNYALSEFLGTDRLKANKPIKQTMAFRGFNMWVRHPLYSTSYFVLLCVFLISPNDLILIIIVLISIYFPIGIYFEEKKLEIEFGDSYLEYKKKTPMLFPGISLIKSMFKKR